MKNNKPYIVKPRYENEKYFKELGIEIIPSPPRGTYVNLPDGWSFKTESSWIAESTTIYDENGRGRIYSAHFFPTKRYVQDDILTVWKRYNIRETTDYSGEVDMYKVTIVDFAEKTIDNPATEHVVFSAGVASNRDELVKKCNKYMDEHYPDWNNPLAYWD